MDHALIKAMVMAESGFDPSAVSSKGAVGLMQLMPGTAESLGVVNRFNPEQNVRGGVRYIKKLIKRLDGDLKLAIAAYNSGLAPVLRHKGIPPYKATRIYVHKVLHYYEYYRNQPDVQARQDKGDAESGDNGDEA
jgi:soluble lytic murein transglycosylase-like protein